MVLVVFGLILQIPVRFHWIAQSVVVMVLALGACVWLFILVLLVCPESLLPGRVFAFVDIYCNRVDMCWRASFMSFFDGFVVLLLGNLFVERCHVNGVWSCFMETLSVRRRAINAFVQVKGCVIYIEALCDAIGGARCAFVLLLGCRFCRDLCWGTFGFFFLSTGF